jgi:hypothetical protein
MALRGYRPQTEVGQGGRTSILVQVEKGGITFRCG